MTMKAECSSEALAHSQTHGSRAHIINVYILNDVKISKSYKYEHILYSVQTVPSFSVLYSVRYSAACHDGLFCGECKYVRAAVSLSTTLSWQRFILLYEYVDADRRPDLM